MKPLFLTPAMLSILCASLSADISTPAFFNNGMVLQQEIGASIWGKAPANASVNVTFANQTKKITADAKGNWKITLKGLKASAKGSVLTITSGDDKKVINDVLVGEVWIASGQSNMEWNMSRTNSATLAKTANDPLLRMYMAPNVSIDKPQSDFKGKWQATTPSSTPTFSAVGYHFAANLRKELNVPVGIIEAAWGGKPVESFISDSAMKALPEAKILVERKTKAVQGYSPEKAEETYNKQLKKFEVVHAAWKDSGKKGRAPRKPRKGTNPANYPNVHSTIFNGMINPIAGYGARGAIWYQGESNANPHTQHIYGELLTSMVKDWRARWNSDLSFYYVQLANFRKPVEKAGTETAWVIIQDEQRRALNTIPKSGMAVINDIGAANNIHPANKKDVGHRLALWALEKDYGKKGKLISGPLYKAVEFKANEAIVSFDYDTGLKSRDGKPLARFEVAGENGTWVWASAKIKGNQVHVSADTVKKATKVRYAWAENPTGANLVNAAGLPSSCFSSESK